MSVPPTGCKLPTIGILTHTAVADDPRVRRQIEAFTAAGWRVLSFGASGGRSPAPPGRHFEADMPANNRSARSRLSRLSLLSCVKALPPLAHQAFWLLPENHRVILRLAEQHHPDLWLANDWTMLPVVTKLARMSHIPFIYDTHEFASDEFPDNWKWRTFVRPLVHEIERAGITRASHVTCVSDGIAARLKELYHLGQPPTVVRNLPQYSPHAFRPTRECIRVLYHGIVMPGRGLEETIQSVAKWRQEFMLTIRGPATDFYLSELKALAADCGVADRIQFDPPVPFTKLIAAAARHDIGLFVLPSMSPQSEFVLPNKLFEYIMAGLALCVSNAPEMTKIIQNHALGKLVDDVSPDSIASAVNFFDRGRIDACKQHSIEAAKKLCWEHEQKKLLTIADSLVFRH